MPSGVKVVHFLPESGKGGAELAAVSAARKRDDLCVVFLQNSPTGSLYERANVISGVAPRLFSVRAVRGALRIVDRYDPDVIVFSLWKSFLVFVSIRLFRSHKRLALLLHSSKNTHLLDGLFNFVMYRLADVVFADSKSSLCRFGSPSRRRTRVISFLVHRLDGRIRSDPAPRFIYWGRMHVHKGIPGAIDFIQYVVEHYPGAKFVLIGPDQGLRWILEEQVRSAGLGANVRFEEPMSLEEITRVAATFHFFLQLSTLEGMSTAVVEAMQLGLVAVVTPVGEIVNYCRDMENGVIYDGRESAFAKVRTLLEDPVAYRQTSEAAIATWAEKPIYADDFLAAVEEVIEEESA